jgi:hypothetical protein
MDLVIDRARGSSDGITMSVLKIWVVLISNIIAPAVSGSNDIFSQDTLKESQILYNGRVWRNLYASIMGDQFLFSPELLTRTGTVVMDGHVFRNVPLKYDIYRDELITETEHGILLQLNKEMVDSFSLNYFNHDYLFIRSDSAEEYSGYINLLYKGRSSFLVKYLKKIELLAVEKKFDQFYQVNRMYLVRGETIDQFAGRMEFFKLMGDHKREVRSYMKKNRIVPSKKDPATFIPLIKFYDTL